MIRVRVRLTPRGGVNRVDGVLDGMLRVRVAAPPVDGAANDALVRLLARELRVPRSRVVLVSGAGARIKVLTVDGVAARDLVARWPSLEIG
jgi:hypothetical protein